MQSRGFVRSDALRALYFLLADMADRFRLLKYGLAIVLVFIGGKMMAMPWFHLPVQWSLAIVGSSIAVSVLLSLKLSARKPTITATKRCPDLKEPLPCQPQRELRPRS